MLERSARMVNLHRSMQERLERLEKQPSAEMPVGDIFLEIFSFFGIPKLTFAMLTFEQEHDRREKETEAHYRVAFSVLSNRGSFFSAESSDQTSDKNHKML